MLVLTRRKNQSIVIGDDIVITVLEVKGDSIRLGITAPRDVQVYREELLAAVQEANSGALLGQSAAPAAPPAAPPRPASATVSAAQVTASSPGPAAAASTAPRPGTADDPDTLTLRLGRRRRRAA